MKNIQNNSWLFLSIILLLSLGCKKEESRPSLEKKKITTVKFNFATPDVTGQGIQFSYQDLDGTDGNDPIIHADTLRPNTVYFVNLEFWDENETPAKNVTKEIEADQDSHQVFFSTFGLDIEIIYADSDSNNLPVGLVTALRTGMIGEGDLIVSLVSKPDKFAEGVSDGVLNNAGGTLDIQVSFPVVIMQ